MKAAELPLQRPNDAKLLVIDAAGRLQHVARARLAQLLCPGDLLIANDAATLPASLSGFHLRSAAPVEVRLAARGSLKSDDVRAFDAVVFGAGDHRTRTEDRAAPPTLQAGDTLALGPLRATVLRTLGHPRLIGLRVVDAIVSGTHEPGSSHHGLLHAFVSAEVLQRADAALAQHGYRSHEFGDSVMIERTAAPCRECRPATAAHPTAA